MSEYAALTRPSAPARTSLGDRVRQLRIAPRPDPDRPGRRTLLEGVRQPDRARQDPSDHRDDRVAGGAPRRRLELPRDRRLLERARARRERDRRAEACIENAEFAEAVEALDKLAPGLQTVAAPELELRALLATGWARMYLGEVRKAIEALDRGRGLSEAPTFSDVDRAEVLFRLATCRYKLNSISTAVALYSQALDLVERSGLPSDRLRSHIYAWRSRCYRRQRDFEGPRRTSSARSSSRRASTTPCHGERLLPGLARRRAHRPLGRRALLREKARAIYEELRDRRTSASC